MKQKKLIQTFLLSELFGHEKGSFTGAIEQKIGKFELADSGTLFLDEVGDMSLEVQSKLLRVLEERSFERVGGVKKIQVDVRLIAATNRDIQKLIEAGQFRQDLYYRLNVISCHLPPLRERFEDIPLLMSHFLKLYNQRYNKNVLSINAGLFTRLTKYSWPGNVRELQNIINQAVLLCDGEEIINYHEKKLISKVLSDNKQNRTRTAQDLEITRKTLARKIDKYNL